MKLIKTKTASSFLFRVDFWFLAKKSSALVCVVSVPWNTFCSSLVTRGGADHTTFPANSPGKTVMAIFC